MKNEKQALRNAIGDAGFAEIRFDEHHQHVALLITDTGDSKPVFLRFARTPSRFAAEYAALDLLRRHLGNQAPAPQVVAALPTVGAGVLALSYELGVNLADFIPADAPVPTLPISYIRSSPGQLHDFQAVLEAIGRAVKKVHQIHPEQFGKFVGDNPNPYRTSARQFTQQEAKHHLGVCVQQGWFDRAFTRTIEQWLAEYLQLIDETEQPCFIHYDLHAGNIRITRGADGRWQFLTLLDFEMARAWLPEQDLAILSWYLRGFDDGWWHAFLQGYGQTNPWFKERIHLFEVIKSLGAMAYSEQANWRHWCRARIDVLLAC